MKTNLTSTLEKSVFFAALAFSLATSIAWAQESREEGRRNGPPPEAIEACVDMQEGDTVSFETRRGDTVNGECKMIEDQLVAVPEGHERKRRN